MEELQFPLEFDKCPNCGSSRRVANEILEKEKAKGKAGPSTQAFLAQYQSAIVDMTKAVLSVPVITSLLGACADCGTAYFFRIAVQSVTPGMRPRS